MAIDKSKPERRSAANKKRGNQYQCCQTRQIKVTQSYYDYQLKSQPFAAARPVPWVQLKGYWLHNAGFTINTPIKVRVMDGCIVLTID